MMKHEMCGRAVDGIFLPFCGLKGGRGSDRRLGEERKERKERDETKTGVASGAKWNSIIDLRFFKEQLRVEV